MAGDFDLLLDAAEAVERAREFCLDERADPSSKLHTHSEFIRGYDAAIADVLAVTEQDADLPARLRAEYERHRDEGDLD